MSANHSENFAQTHAAIVSGCFADDATHSEGPTAIAPILRAFQGIIRNESAAAATTPPPSMHWALFDGKGKDAALFQATRHGGLTMLTGLGGISPPFMSIIGSAAVWTGRWAYEATLLTTEATQIGWCAPTDVVAGPFLAPELGVGDVAGSIGMCVARRTLYGAGKDKSVPLASIPPIQLGDVLTCLLDLNEGIAEFLVNGQSVISVPVLCATTVAGLEAGRGAQSPLLLHSPALVMKRDTILINDGASGVPFLFVPSHYRGIGMAAASVAAPSVPPTPGTLTRTAHDWQRRTDALLALSLELQRRGRDHRAGSEEPHDEDVSIRRVRRVLIPAFIAAIGEGALNVLPTSSTVPTAASVDDAERSSIALANSIVAAEREHQPQKALDGRIKETINRSDAALELLWMAVLHLGRCGRDVMELNSDVSMEAAHNQHWLTIVTAVTRLGLVNPPLASSISTVSVRNGGLALKGRLELVSVMLAKSTESVATSFLTQTSTESQLAIAVWSLTMMATRWARHLSLGPASEAAAAGGDHHASSLAQELRALVISMLGTFFAVAPTALRRLVDVALSIIRSAVAPNEDTGALHAAVFVSLSEAVLRHWSSSPLLSIAAAFSNVHDGNRLGGLVSAVAEQLRHAAKGSSLPPMRGDDDGMEKGMALRHLERFYQAAVKRTMNRLFLARNKLVDASGTAKEELRAEVIAHSAVALPWQEASVGTYLRLLAAIARDLTAVANFPVPDAVTVKLTAPSSVASAMIPASVLDLAGDCVNALAIVAPRQLAEFIERDPTLVMFTLRHVGDGEVATNPRAAEALVSIQHLLLQITPDCRAVRSASLKAMMTAGLRWSSAPGAPAADARLDADAGFVTMVKRLLRSYVHSNGWPLALLTIAQIAPCPSALSYTSAAVADGLSVSTLAVDGETDYATNPSFQAALFAPPVGSEAAPHLQLVPEKLFKAAIARINYLLTELDVACSSTTDGSKANPRFCQVFEYLIRSGVALELITDLMPVSQLMEVSSVTVSDAWLTVTQLVTRLRPVVLHVDSAAAGAAAAGASKTAIEFYRLPRVSSQRLWPLVVPVAAAAAKWLAADSTSHLPGAASVPSGGGSVFRRVLLSERCSLDLEQAEAFFRHALDEFQRDRSAQPSLVAIYTPAKIAAAEDFVARLAEARANKRFPGITRQSSSTSMSDEGLCTLCVAETEDYELQPCGHRGCQLCLERYMEDAKTCFVCRRPITSMRRLPPK